MKRFAVLLLVGCVACSAGLATMPGGPKPAWVGAAQIPDYPQETFLTGIGMAPVNKNDLQATQSAADAAARVDLSKKVEVSVSSEFTSFQSESNKNGASTSEQSVSELTQEAVKGMDLEGVEIKTRWMDEASGVGYALAVWPKARAEALLRAKMTEAETLAKKAEADGDAQLAAAPAAALKQYMTARLALEKAQNDAVLMRAVTGKAAVVPDVAPIRSKLARLVDEVNVTVDGGDGQRVKGRGAAPQPLLVRATLRNAPLVGLPLTFALPGGSVDATAMTDAQGIASARVTTVGDLTNGPTKVMAQVDWAGLAGAQPAPAWAQNMRPIKLSFGLVPSTLGSTRVLVKIIEKIDDAPNLSLSAMQSAMSTALSGAGFGVQDGEALTARVPVAQLLTLDPKAFQKEARDLADVVVVGEAVSSYSSTLAGEVMIHRARLNLRAVDLGTGEVIATLTLEQKGQPGKGPEKAGRKALDALAHALGPDFCKNIKERMGF